MVAHHPHPISHLTGKIESFFTFILRLHWHIFPPSSPHYTALCRFCILHFISPGAKEEISPYWKISFFRLWLLNVRSRALSWTRPGGEGGVTSIKSGVGLKVKLRLWWDTARLTQCVPLSPPVALHPPYCSPVSLTIWPRKIINKSLPAENKNSITSPNNFIWQGEVDVEEMRGGEAYKVRYQM